MPRHSPIRTLRYGCETLAAYVLYGVFRILPVSVASAIGGTLVRWLGPLSGAHKTATKNLALSLPDIEKDDQRAVLKEVWDNLGRVMAEYATLSRLWGSSATSRIEVQGAEHIQRLAEAGSPAIIFSGHIGNWEAITLTVARVASPPAIVYRAPNNPYVESLIRYCRGPTASLQIPKGQSGARDIVRQLRSGGFVAMLVDQKSNTGRPIPLFGRDAMTGDAVARIALKLKCPIVPAHVERLDGCRFKVSFEEPWSVESSIDNEDDDASVQDLLIRINAKLESWIREQPGQWLWPHNRWPKDSDSS